MILGVTALTPILAFNPQFLVRWLGPGIDGGERVVVAAAINAVLVGLATQWQWVFLATGRVGLLTRPALASAVLNVAASVLFTRHLGIVGPLLGTTVAYAAVHAWYLPVMLRRHFGISIRALAWAVAAPVLAGAPYAAGLWWLARDRPAPGWIGLAAEMGISALAFLAFSVAVLMDPTDRAIWRARLAGILHLRPSRGDA